jgi:hypothetical protein
MPVCRSGIFAVGVYLAIEVNLFIYAYLHPSGLFYEYLPFAYLTFPWYLFFEVALSRVIGGFGCMFAGMLANALTIYFAFVLISQYRKKRLSLRK